MIAIIALDLATGITQRPGFRVTGPDSPVRQPRASNVDYPERSISPLIACSGVGAEDNAKLMSPSECL